MSSREEKIAIFKKYRGRIGGRCYVGGNIPAKLVNNARNKFAYGLDVRSIVCLCDESLWGNGKDGFLFTDDRVYYTELFEAKTLWYDEITGVTPDQRNHDIYISSAQNTSRCSVVQCNVNALAEAWMEIVRLEKG